MLPIGLLMIEHRLIERVVPLLEREQQRLQQGDPPDVRTLSAAVDFLGTYADRCHHGKEEHILFAALREKELPGEHQRILDELLREHEQAREAVGHLSDGLPSDGKGDTDREKVDASLQALIPLYREHIAKEDKRFFIPCMDYFSDDEKASMIESFYEFDRQLIHEKYKGLIEGLESRRGSE